MFFILPDMNPCLRQHAPDTHVLHRVIFTDIDEKIVNELY